MKEDAGNEYMGKDITIDVTVVAGQMTAESDSFDNQYDKDAKLGVITVTPSDINEKLMNLEIILSSFFLHMMKRKSGILWCN